MRIPLALVVMLFGVIACSSSPTDSLSDAPVDVQAFLAGDYAVGIRAGTPIVLPGTDVPDVSNPQVCTHQEWLDKSQALLRAVQ
ncbi:MAG: hypothetical protein K2Y26_07330 [Gemmatimonadaceae bacterium]|nr:hypothetical protein [Gemmatimonadaceae bacterium]